MMQGSIVEANVIRKKKRDERANREKQELLNPERLERAKIKRKKKIFFCNFTLLQKIYRYSEEKPQQNLKIKL